MNAAYSAGSSNLPTGACLIAVGQIDRLDSGAYQDTVNFVDSNGNTTTVTVNLTVTGAISGNSGVTVSPTSLGFTSVTVTGPTAGTLGVDGISGTQPA